MMPHTELSPAEAEALLATLQARFERHPARHAGLHWPAIAARLSAQPDKLRSLQAMEQSGGEPDVIGQDAESGAYLFCDCAAQSPTGRRSTCYDRAAREDRKANAPEDSACEMAAAMGIELLTEAQYLALQAFGPFDTTTSSWLQTPPALRQLGGALFGDYRFGRAFVYHNGAQSYYAARGFRGLLRV